MLYVTKQDYKTIVAYCQQQLPFEACGLLGGRVDGVDGYVKSVLFLTNIDYSETHFSMNPKEQFATIKDLRSCGFVLLGNFHSHPKTSAEPSKEDRRLANDRGFRYLILSFMDAKPVLRAFYLNEKGRLEEEKLVVV